MPRHFLLVATLILVIVVAGCHSGAGLLGPLLQMVVDAQVRGDFNVAVNAQAQDDGATIVTIAVTFDGQTQTVNGAQGTVTFNTGELAGGTTHNVVAVATDSNGETTQVTRQVTIANLAPPTVEITAPAEGAEVGPGDFDVTATGTANEAGATITQIVVTINGANGQTINGETGTLTFNTGDLGLDAGEAVAIVATVTDSNTLTGTDTVNCTVGTTAAPTVQITAPANGANVEGVFAVNVTGAAQEPGATLANIAVTFGGHTETIPGAGTADLAGTVQFDSTQDPPVATAVANGQYTITAVATDSLGVTGQAQITVTSDNFLLAPANVTGEAGGQIVVPINLSDTTDVAGFSMTINYDADRLSAPVVAAGAAVPAGALVLPNTTNAGVITVAVAGTTPFLTTSNEILTVTFTAGNTAGATQVSINPTGTTPLAFSNAMAQPITPLPTCVPGTVTIQ